MRTSNRSWVSDGTETRRKQNKTWVGKGDRLSDMALMSAAAGGSDDARPELPRGRWAGWYRQYRRQHQLFSFNLDFLPSAKVHNCGMVRGFGSDDVGTYKINKGSYNLNNGRVCFTKKYRAGTGDRTENLGHSVEYHGTFQGSLAAGLRGTWFVNTHRCKCSRPLCICSLPKPQRSCPCKQTRARGSSTSGPSYGRCRPPRHS